MQQMNFCPVAEPQPGGECSQCILPAILSSDAAEAPLRHEAGKFGAQALESDRPGLGPSPVPSHPSDTG